MIELILDGAKKDLGGFSVARVLPQVKRRSVGPFVFYDQMGPADFPPGQGIDVRPHPHIGLSTLTYLFAGRIMHFDSLGFHQAIEAGAVNWMTAGRAITHSERTTLTIWPAARLCTASRSGLRCRMRTRSLLRRLSIFQPPRCLKSGRTGQCCG